MKKYAWLLLICLASEILIAGNYNIIPYPAKLTPKSGAFEFDNQTQFVVDGFDERAITPVVKLFSDQLALVSGGRVLLPISTKRSTTNAIIFKRDSSISQSGAYRLKVSKLKIEITAGTLAGCFYALQTIRQLLPNEVDAKVLQPTISWEVPCCDITDTPQFAYRGMHLDVSRHFASVGEVKKLIDQIAFLKLNKFHWHLTDDQGWRIEIKKYPRLTSVGGFRNQTLIGHSSTVPQKYDQTKTGGFYTQEEIRDVVKYASELFVDVIPEIEMPGHSMAALSAYPQFSCSGGPFDVASKWGIFNDIYCSKESSIQFLQDVLSEVMELFPSKYIHIGGDEAPKIRWKNCVNCQTRIKELGLKNEQELQSYFISRIEQFVNQHGKLIIGWDEILEGGLAQNATVMSWRGEQGGIRAAQMGHDVVMTPGSHLYLDAYQSQLTSEPLAIGGFSPLEKVYSYHPVPETLKVEERKHILGLQANVWTEYMQTEAQREYMIFPRIAAVAEAAWSGSHKPGFEDFAGRLPSLFDRYNLFGFNYSKAFYDINATPKVADYSLKLVLSARGNSILYYTTDGSSPTESSAVYHSLIDLGANEVTVKAQAYLNGKPMGGLYSQLFAKNLFAGAEVKLSKSPSPKYPGKGALTLVDCISGRYPILGSQWLGYEGNDVEIEVNLAKPTAVLQITLGTSEKTAQWIYSPSKVELLVSEDGLNYRSIGVTTHSEIVAANGKAIFKLSNTIRKAKIIVTNFGMIPAELQGGGHRAWLFMDEITAE